MSGIIVRIVGGLGNQLFCYAAARRLSLANGVPLKLDAVSGFRNDQYGRVYLLDKFNIKAQKASPLESFDFRGGRLARYAARKANRLVRFERRRYIVEETEDRFDPRMLGIRPVGSVYLEGYWQSPKYFLDVEDDLRRDLAITEPHEEITIQESLAIKKAENPVCLGVRLFQETAGNQNIMSRDYYLAAMDKMASAIPNAHFFVFCNDAQWVMKNLEIRHPHTFITPKPESERACEDLWLMGLCNHFIIPNSTYHWWGAWLSKNKAKIVFAPKHGFPNAHTVPSEWNVI